MIDNNDERIPFDEEGLHNMLDALNSFGDAASSNDEDDDDELYRVLYLKMFNGISLIRDNTDTYEQTVDALKILQCKAEEYYISRGQPDREPDDNQP